METLSDHEYMTFSVATIPVEIRARRKEKDAQCKRWALRKMDVDVFQASIQCALMARGDAEEQGLEDRLNWVLSIIEAACDASMPRAKFRPPKKAYWWSDSLADLRKQLVHAKRRASHHRGNEEVWQYRSLRDELRRDIRAAKARSWGELLSSLDRDPWGCPYRMVLGKLKSGASPMTETLDPLFVQEVVDMLFLSMENGLNDPIPGREYEEAMHVSRAELRGVVRIIKSAKAPGSDGVSSRAWCLPKRSSAKT